MALKPRRQQSSQEVLSVASVHRATKRLKLLPYQFQAVHQLQKPDTAVEIKYFHWFRCFVREEVHVL